LNDDVIYDTIIDRVKRDKLLKKAINNPGSLHFGEFETLLSSHGFERLRSKGSHVHYFNPAYRRLLPVQEKNGMAKE